MAITVFGVTGAKVAAHHFPQISAFSTASKPTLATVGEMIDDSGARLGGALRAEGVTPSSITSADYPEAYAWCAETVRLGAALSALMAMTGQSPEVAKAWEKKLEARYEDLNDRGHLALGDAPAPTEGSNGPRSHISNHSLDTGDASDISDAIPRFRRDDAL